MKNFNDYMKARKNEAAQMDAPPSPKHKIKGISDKVPAAGSPAQYNPHPHPEASNKLKVKPEKDGLMYKQGGGPVYNPGEKNSMSKVPEQVATGGYRADSAWTSESDSFIDATQHMSPSEYADFMADIVKNETNAPGHPIQYIKYVASLMKKNGTNIESMVREAKRSGFLGNLVFEILQHPESFDTISDMMADPIVGPSFCRKLARKLTENVGAPVGVPGSDPSMDDDEEEPMGDDQGNVEGPEMGPDGQPMEPDMDEPSDDDEIDPNDPDALLKKKKKKKHPDDLEMDDEPTDDLGAGSAEPDPMAGAGVPPAAENLLKAMSGHRHLTEGMKRVTKRRK